jgi:hypothetical protein
MRMNKELIRLGDLLKEQPEPGDDEAERRDDRPR